MPQSDVTARSSATPPAATPPADPIPAATVILLREVAGTIHTLLLRRNEAIKAYGGLWVFPGGKVDAEDGEHGSELELAKHCASRELMEETSISLAVDCFLPLSHWTTPVGRPKRFATWFFVAQCEADRVIVDGSEIEEHEWISPQAALDKHSRDEIELAPPTFVSLDWLAGFSGIQQLLQSLPAEPLIYLPRSVKTEEGVYSLYQEDVAYETLDTREPGPLHRLDMTSKPYRYLKTS